MKDDISPEERLLRLIKNPKKKNIQDVREEKGRTQTVTSDLKPVLKASAYPLIQRYFSFIYIQKIITVGFIIAGGYFIFSFISPWIGFKKNDLPSVSKEKIMDTEIESKKQEIKPFEFYLEGLKDRKIFGSLSQPETQVKTVRSPELTDLVKDLNLLGIISGENPEAIIEDKKIGKTYYVTKGESIGEFQVEDIQEGKVILNYQDERCELYL